MHRQELAKRAYAAIDSVKAGQAYEESYVEFKARLPHPEEAARDIAAMANAAREEEILWIVGVDQKGKVWGTGSEELANWYPQVRKHFDGPAPSLLKNINLSVGERTVTVLCLNCPDVPYIIKNGVKRDFLWREGNATRWATREEVVKILAEKDEPVRLPDVDYLSEKFEPVFHQDGRLAQLDLWIQLYVKLRGQAGIVLPRHDCKVSVVGAGRRVEFDEVYIYESPAKGGTFPEDMSFDKPGPLYMFAMADWPGPVPKGPVTLEIHLLPVGAKAPIKIKKRTKLNLPAPPPQAPQAPREILVGGPFEPFTPRPL